MNCKTIIRGIVATPLLAALLLPAGCTKNEQKAEAPPALPSAGGASAEKPGEAQPGEALAETIGVEPGPVKQTEAPLATLQSVSGEIALRRLGEEAFTAASKDAPLYAGDQVQAAEGASAVILFADTSTAEVAEVSTVAVGSRAVTPDPASSAAVLAGVARFSVAPRVPGEGPFIVYTPAGVIATKGTVFGVGVAADGDARVGVESGAVEVAGSAAFDAPVDLEASSALALSAQGQLEAPGPWPADDWGAWRDQAEAELDVTATADAHAAGMAELEGQLTEAYDGLAKLEGEVAQFDADVAVKAEAEDTAGYEGRLPEGAAAVDASFLAALRLQWLTHAHAARAALARDLYIRHSDQVAWPKLSGHAAASVLWCKRFDATSVTMLEPLRAQYYLHHPKGRAHAKLVGLTVPPFYARVTPPEVPTAKVKARLRFKPFTPPGVHVTASARPVWIGAPGMNWRAKLKGQAAPARGKAAFWVRPPSLKSKLMLGAKATAQVPSAFAVHPPEPRGQLKAGAKLALGQHVRLSPPDLHAAAKARSELSATAPHGSLHARREASAALRLPKGKTRLKAKAAAGKRAGAAKAKAKANVRLKAKAPAVKPPKLKLQAKASAKLKLGK